MRHTPWRPGGEKASKNPGVLASVAAIVPPTTRSVFNTSPIPELSPYGILRLRPPRIAHCRANNGYYRLHRFTNHAQLGNARPQEFRGRQPNLTFDVSAVEYRVPQIRKMRPVTFLPACGRPPRPNVQSGLSVSEVRSPARLRQQEHEHERARAEHEHRAVLIQPGAWGSR